MADAQAVQVVQKFFEQVQELLEKIKSDSETKQLEVLNGILNKAGFIERRVEMLQKLPRDQWHMVEILLEFDDQRGGRYGFLRSIKDVLSHCPFENDSDQQIFLWAAQLKARGETLYAVFDLERQIIQAKSLQARVEDFSNFEDTDGFKENIEENVKWLEKSLAEAQEALQLALRN